MFTEHRQQARLFLTAAPYLECSKSCREVTMKPRVAALSISLALAFLAPPVPSHVQLPGKIYRIGYLFPDAPASTDTSPEHCPIKGGRNWQAFVAGLGEHGYLPGPNRVIECRWTEGRGERALALAVGVRPT